MNSSPAQSSLEGAWVEVMKAGDYGERGHWSPEDLDRLALSYDPRLQPAPVVLGHPTDDAPAYGWVRCLRRAGQALWAQLEKVDPAFEALLRAGRFRQRSVSLYKHFPPTGGPYLRHLGFLGAAAPAVKGLAPVRPAHRSLGVGGFADAASIAFTFDTPLSPTQLNPVSPQFNPVACPACPEHSRRAPATGFEETMDPEDPMSEPKSKLDSFLDHLRAFFSPQTESQPPVIPPAPSGSEGSDSEGSAFSERLAALEQRLDTLASEKENAEKKLTEAESDQRRQQVAVFVDSLRRAGRFPPAFERWGVVEFIERLAALESYASFASSASSASPEAKETVETEEKPAPPSPLAWFQDFLTKLPAVIHFEEIAAPATAHGSRVAPRRASVWTGHESRLVRFTEPQRGMSVDPASIELAERAEALAAELGITYAEALTQLRQENHHTATTA